MAGGGRLQSPEQLLVMDASGALDPDYPDATEGGLDYAWNCSHVCWNCAPEDTIDCNAALAQVGIPTDLPVLVVGPSSLPPGDFAFDLTFISSRGPVPRIRSSGVLHVSLQENAPALPHIFLQGPEAEFFNPADVLRITGAFANQPSLPTLSCSLSIRLCFSGSTLYPRALGFVRSAVCSTRCSH